MWKRSKDSRTDYRFYAHVLIISGAISVVACRDRVGLKFTSNSASHSQMNPSSSSHYSGFQLINRLRTLGEINKRTRYNGVFSMNNMISHTMNSVTSFLKQFRLERLFVVVLAGFLLLVNTACSSDNSVLLATLTRFVLPMHATLPQVLTKARDRIKESFTIPFSPARVE